ncbi:MATH/TRAF domain [Arabidopsis suecica]|uniref:MATH/TRAF domain n=1 Tax=Arabidopsis suecica TaxID=45249 RepID=A0A8T2HFF1_ARASU|nr:MATH/TRAF domain [Arabidopsis suecica]
MGASCSAPVSSTIKKNWRDHPPSSYSLKIHNFSQLEKTTSFSGHKYQSRLFSSGDITNVEIKRFDALKMVWGLPKGNECEFGVDVIVAPPLTNWEILSFHDEKLSYPKVTWSVKNFSQWKENECSKPNRFSIGGREWVLKLFPKGNSRAKGKYLSVFLYLADNETLKPDEKIFTQVVVRILNPLGSNHVASRLNYWHKGSNFGYGWCKFLSLDKIRKTYLDKEDTLMIEAEFEVVSATKFSTII